MHLKRAINVKSVTEKIKRVTFEEESMGLFDIAHNRSLVLKKNSEANIFVNYQRDPMQKGNLRFEVCVRCDDEELYQRLVKRVVEVDKAKNAALLCKFHQLSLIKSMNKRS